jgi:hypothetical protein
MPDHRHHQPQRVLGVDAFPLGNDRRDAEPSDHKGFQVHLPQTRNHHMQSHTTRRWQPALPDGYGQSRIHEKKSATASHNHLDPPMFPRPFHHSMALPNFSPGQGAVLKYLASVVLVVGVMTAWVLATALLMTLILKHLFFD